MSAPRLRREMKPVAPRLPLQNTLPVLSRRDIYAASRSHLPRTHHTPKLACDVSQKTTMRRVVSDIRFPIEVRAAEMLVLPSIPHEARDICERSETTRPSD